MNTDSLVCLVIWLSGCLVVCLFACLYCSDSSHALHGGYKGCEIVQSMVADPYIGKYRETNENLCCSEVKSS
jgi:hypothetical protein